MFDFAWSEIALIGVVALIAIGPKDMPVAIKAVTTAIKKARRMAAEFQTHVDDMMKEADLQEVRESFNQIRNFDLKGTVERAVDPDGSLRTTLSKNPLAADPVIHTPAPTEPELVGEAAIAGPQPAETPAPPVELSPPPVEPAPCVDEAPAFIPPAFAAKPEPAPEFVPPNVKRRSLARA